MGLGAELPHVADGGGLVYEATATTNVTVEGVAAQESTMTTSALSGEVSITVSGRNQGQQGREERFDSNGWLSARVGTNRRQQRHGRSLNRSMLLPPDVDRRVDSLPFATAKPDTCPMYLDNQGYLTLKCIGCPPSQSVLLLPLLLLLWLITRFSRHHHDHDRIVTFITPPRVNTAKR